MVQEMFGSRSAFGQRGGFARHGIFSPYGLLGRRGPLGPHGPLGRRGPLGPYGPLGSFGRFGMLGRSRRDRLRHRMFRRRTFGRTLQILLGIAIVAIVIAIIRQGDDSKNQWI